MRMMNRLANCHNRFQGEAKKVLCVCSAGLLRSPTAAWVLSNPPFNFNTRAVGCSEEYALIPVDDVLLTWADEIVAMEPWHRDVILTRLSKLKMTKPVRCLDIPDSFERMHPELIEAIKETYGRVESAST